MGCPKRSWSPTGSNWKRNWVREHSVSVHRLSLLRIAESSNCKVVDDAFTVLANLVILRGKWIFMDLASLALSLTQTNHTSHHLQFCIVWICFTNYCVIVQWLKFQNLGVIFEAWDCKRKENVALKIEKKDKIKTILLFEYKVLTNLQRKYIPAHNYLAM